MYSVLAYYHFVTIENPELEVERHKKFFKNRDAAGRIYISHNGINGQMSAATPDAQAYMEWLKTDARFATVEFKIHEASENVFPRMTVKFRKQLVAIDEVINLADAGEHASPQEWKRMLEDDEESVLIDVRNDYEWKVGRFEGAELPPCETFRDFTGYAKELKTRVAPDKTRVMMYCTGGIRCELYSALLKQEGFEKVVQLQGGVIKYGLEEGNQHWEGKLFVFDDRLTIPISKDEPSVIGRCHHCDTPTDIYYNCANMDCNDLFLCCDNCREAHAGCCASECRTAERVRQVSANQPSKPFRRMHLLK